MKVLCKKLGSQLYGLSKEELTSFQSAMDNKEKKKEKRLRTWRGHHARPLTSHNTYVENMLKIIIILN